MKKALLFSLLFVSIFSFSQKIEKDQIDKFTGEHHISTSIEKISTGLGCSLIKNNNVLSLFVMYDCENDVLTVSKDSEFLIRFSTSEILKLKVPESRTSNLIAGGSYLDISFVLDSISIDKLQTNLIEGVRFYTSKFYVERDVSKKDSKKLQALFNLIR